MANPSKALCIYCEHVSARHKKDGSCSTKGCDCSPEKIKQLFKDMLKLEKEHTHRHNHTHTKERTHSRAYAHFHHHTHGHLDA